MQRFSKLFFNLTYLDIHIRRSCQFILHTLKSTCNLNCFISTFDIHIYSTSEFSASVFLTECFHYFIKLRLNIFDRINIHIYVDSRFAICLENFIHLFSSSFRLFSQYIQLFIRTIKCNYETSVNSGSRHYLNKFFTNTKSFSDCFISTDNLEVETNYITTVVSLDNIFMVKFFFFHLTNGI